MQIKKWDSFLLGILAIAHFMQCLRADDKESTA